MKKSLNQILRGYREFRKKYVLGDQSIMQFLSDYGQQPKFMVVACCDSRVDPALILQCDPGDLFVVRNVANIIPRCEKKDSYHCTSAALEFGIRFLKIKHLIILGHSQCGGIKALLHSIDLKNDINTGHDYFITDWVSLIQTDNPHTKNTDEYAKLALNQSYQNCMTFPWLQEKVIKNKLLIHLWFFDIKSGQIFTYNEQEKIYKPLE